MQDGEGPSKGGPPLKGAAASWAAGQAQPSPKLQAKWTSVDRSLSSSFIKGQMQNEACTVKHY